MVKQQRETNDLNIGGLIAVQCLSAELLTLAGLLAAVESGARAEPPTEARVCVTSLTDCLHEAQLALRSRGSARTEQLSVTSPHQV